MHTTVEPISVFRRELEHKGKGACSRRNPGLLLLCQFYKCLQKVIPQILPALGADADSQQSPVHGRVTHPPPFNQALDPSEAGRMVE